MGIEAAGTLISETFNGVRMLDGTKWIIPLILIAITLLIITSIPEDWLALGLPVAIVWNILGLTISPVIYTILAISFVVSAMSMAYGIVAASTYFKTKVPKAFIKDRYKVVTDSEREALSYAYDEGKGRINTSLFKADGDKGINLDDLGRPIKSFMKGGKIVGQETMSPINPKGSLAGRLNPLNIIKNKKRNRKI